MSMMNSMIPWRAVRLKAEKPLSEPCQPLDRTKRKTHEKIMVALAASTASLTARSTASLVPSAM